MAKAVIGAGDGDTIEIRGNGPFVLQPIDFGDKALRLRAGEGAWPVLELAPDAARGELRQITTRAALTLEGLEFQREVGGKDGSGGLSHIYCENAPVSVVNCRFILRKRSGALIDAVKAEPSRWMQVRNCQFLGDWHAGPHLSWAPSGSRMVVANCVFLTAQQGVGLGILRDAVATAPASLQLQNNTMCGGALIWLQTAGWKIPNGPPAEPRVQIEATGNICGSGFVRFSHFSPSKEADEILQREYRAFANQAVTLQARRNQILPGSSLVQFAVILHSHTMREMEPVTTLTEWQAFWKSEPTELALAKDRFAKELSPEAPALGKLSPLDFRLQADDPAAANLGADVDLVGPGPAYERFRKSPEYQQLVP